MVGLELRLPEHLELPLRAALWRGGTAAAHVALNLTLLCERTNTKQKTRVFLAFPSTMQYSQRMKNEFL